MEAILFGIGGMMPMYHRLLTSVMVRVNGWNYLFDAGEGTQIPLKQSHAGLRNLRMIAVTHLHADHCLGLPGIMMLRAQMDNPAPLTLVGPPGLRKFVQAVQSTLGYVITYPIHFIEWNKKSGGVAYEDDTIRLKWQPMNHSVFCLGYRLEELERPGKFDIEQAEKLGVPQGPFWSELQAGHSVELADQRAITPEMVLGPSRRGRHLAFVVDTRPTASAIQICQNADLAFIEGMFGSEDDAEAVEKKHMTVTEAGRLTKNANVRRSVLVHLSPRIANAELAGLAAEAQTENPNIEIGRRLARYSVLLPEKQPQSD